MRAFIGIELNEPVKKALFSVQQLVMTSSKKGRFTDKDNFHLTLQFIGEANQKEIALLRQIVAETVSEIEAFEIVVDVLSTFQKKKGLILWASPKTADPLLQLYDQVHATMLRLGFPIKKELYTPHITLGRNILWKEDAAPSYNKSLDRMIPIPINNLTLFESVRVNDRLMYRPFARYPLNTLNKPVERQEE